MLHLTFKKSSISKEFIGKSSPFPELANGSVCVNTFYKSPKDSFKREPRTLRTVTYAELNLTLTSGSASSPSVTLSVNQPPHDKKEEKS